MKVEIESRWKLDWSQVVVVITAIGLAVAGMLVTTEAVKIAWGDSARELYHPVLDHSAVGWLLLAAAALSAWLAGRVMPTLVRRPWLAVGLGLACLILPLLLGERHFDNWAIKIRGEAIEPRWQWVPGYLGLLLLVPVLVVLMDVNPK